MLLFIYLLFVCVGIHIQDVLQHMCQHKHRGEEIIDLQESVLFFHDMVVSWSFPSVSAASSFTCWAISLQKNTVLWEGDKITGIEPFYGIYEINPNLLFILPHEDIVTKSFVVKQKVSTRYWISWYRSLDSP